MRINNRSIFKPMAGGAYKIEAKADATTVYLYDEIGWFGVLAEDFVKDLNNITTGTINIHVNSPGGSVFDGVSIYNAIKQHKSNVVAHIDGLAASIASVIVMAADEIKMGENAFLMIHDPFSMVVGTAEDMRKEADLLDKVTGTIAKTYIDRSGIDEDEIKTMMADETWLTADEALDSGFIDFINIDEKKQKKNQTATIFDLSVFMNVPDTLKDEKKEPTARDLERILRDAGCSKNRAKAILATGLGEDDQREVEIPEQREAVKPKIVAKVETNQGDAEKVEGKKKDLVSDLLTRAELVAPSNY